MLTNGGYARKWQFSLVSLPHDGLGDPCHHDPDRALSRMVARSRLQATGVVQITVLGEQNSIGRYGSTQTGGHTPT